MSETDKVEWADMFPEIDAHPTRDPRIFQTPFKTLSKGDVLFGLEALKEKKYFACVVGGNCFGVDVMRKNGIDARKEMEEAFFKVKAAADYYEEHQTWPQ